MLKMRLVPRSLSILELIGGPALLVAGVSILFGGRFGPQIIATVPEFFWELFLGLWLVVKGFDREALVALELRPRPRAAE